MQRSSTTRWTALIIMFAAALLAGQILAAQRTDKRPNIVLILADDFGYECVGANGGTSYKTPNLDRLAASGVRFTHCYAQPLCTPTRVQLMTGQYNVRNYVEFGLLDREQTTFAQLLKQGGDATCIAGKWQLGRDVSLPAHFGFDEHCLWQLSRRPGRYKNPGLEINGKEMDYTHGEYGPDLVSDYALDFLARNKDRPFLLYYPLMLTHDPYEPTPDSADWEDDDKEPGGKRRGNGEEGPRHRHFADMVTYMDKLVGKLLARLDELRLRENTLVLFVGDNGTGRGTRLKMGDSVVIGGKGLTVDSGMHVPLIASGPGVSGGRVCRDLIDTTDFLPTICEAAGVKLPADPAIDGHTFWPQLVGKTGQPRDWIYCWYARDGGPKATHEFARNHDFKLYRGGEFYDVSHGDDDTHPLDRSIISPAAQTALGSLQAVLDNYEHARPARFAKPGRKPAEAE